MLEWWTELGSAGQVFACIAVPATVMLFIQLLLTFIGLGSDGDGGGDGSIDAVDTDGDGIPDTFAESSESDLSGEDDISDGGLRPFTLRGFIAFFSVLGWTGTICCGSGLNTALSIVISAAAGLTAMLVIALIMKWLLGLQYDGTENIKNSLGVSGTVYVRIPPSRSGRGKISAVIDGKLCEKNAVTDENTRIEYGEEITVVGISGEETLIVKRKNKFVKELGNDS